MTNASRNIESFQCQTRIYFGEGALDRLEDFADRRVGVVTDAFMVKSGMLERVLSHLAAGAVEIFAEVIPEPPVEQIVAGAKQLGTFSPDVVIALGGGSVIDAAKTILATIRRMKPDRRIPLVAIPTTSGTGSEVTPYAVISEPKRGLKHPLVSSEMIPDIALLDADLVRSVPPVITADTGMDVITHAIEAFVATNATPFSDAFAEKAFSLACEALPRAHADEENSACRTQMHVASCMAGMAFSASGLGLNHGLAHALGGRLHIPHGRINAMLLPHVVAFNAGIAGCLPQCLSTAERYATLARRIGLGGYTVWIGAQALAQTLARMNADLGIPATLRAAGADLQLCWRALPELVAAALADRTTQTNPRRPDAKDVETLIADVTG